MATLYGVLTNPVWGTNAEASMIVDRLERVEDTEEATLPDGVGDIKHVAYHGKNSTFTCDFKVEDNGYPSASLVGGTFTLANNADFVGEFIVKSVTNTRTAADWMSGSMTMRYFGWAPVANP
jgi:hypothetical protein